MRKYIALTLATAVLYYFSARIGLFLALEHTNATPVWPPSGIAFAVILLFGYRFWPGILAGAFLANLVTFLGNKVADPFSIVVLSVLIGTGNTAEALAGAILVRTLIGLKNPFDRAFNVFKFILISLAVCMIAATIGSTSLLLFKIIPKSFYNSVWVTWWLGDAGGILVLTPMFLIAWFQRSQLVVWKARKLIEALFFLIALIVISQFISDGRFWFGARHYPISFVMIPLIILAAFRFGQIGVIVSVLAMGGLAIWNTMKGYGPFAMQSQNESLLLLQMFIVTITVTGLFLAAVLTERKEAELKQDQLVKELAAVNQELSDFAHVTSHDLKAPLRGIGTIIEWLNQAYGDKFDAQGKEWLAHLNDRLNLAHALIDGILQYSSVGRQKETVTAVHLDSLVRDVIQVVGLDDSLFDVRGPLPVVQCDPIRMRQVFQNLISNAIKYNPKPKKRVTITCTSDSVAFWKFAVADNGPGIEEKYFPKIFQMFETLQPKNKSNSTGIGLPLTKKIVEMYGGKIWVESKMGDGTTFFFTFPRNYQGV